MLTDHRMTRRRALTALLGVALTASLAACAQSTPATSQAVAGAPSSAATSAASGSSAAAQTSAAPSAASQSATTAASTAATQASAAASAASQAVAQVPRNQTLIFSESDAVQQFADVQLMNPFLLGIARSGWQFAFEPLYLYNPYYTQDVCGPAGMSCKNGEIPYQAESYAYNNDYTELTIKLRNGITWSDGQPFTAGDIVFTLNMLKANAPKLTWSVDMHQWVKDVVAVDDHTAKITLTGPNPRFMFSYFQFHEDLGVVIVPEHIFKDQNPQTFTNFDIAKGWPVVTGPWKLTFSNPQQKIWDRNDNWWGAKTGFHPLPKMRRIVDLPNFLDDKRIELLANNEVDATHDLQPANALAALARNPKLEMWQKGSPYGCLDFWTTSMFFNNSKPPFDDPNIRWAINHAINRDQVVQIGYHGAGQKTLLPFPAFTPMLPYFDAVKDLLQQYQMDGYDPNKTAQLMQGKGYQKDSGGFWAKNGTRFPLVIQLSPSFFLDITPVIVAQLRKAGFDASFKSPSDYSTVVSTGQFDAIIDGNGGSINDPYTTLSFFQSRYSAPTGQQATYPYRWKNDQFEQLVNQMAPLPTSDPKVMSLYHQAMEIWIRELPGIPLVQHFLYMPVNTTYWTNWPTSTNPYIIPSNWHRTSTLFINSLEPAQS
jgi:peptide/nickel transport system substrate-binding protein